MYAMLLILKEKLRCCLIKVREIFNILVYFYSKIDYYVFLLNSECSVIRDISLKKNKIFLWKKKKIRKRRKCELSFLNKSSLEILNADMFDNKILENCLFYFLATCVHRHFNNCIWIFIISYT